MPETPKEKRKIEKVQCDELDMSTWSEDQKTREYYYDDAHGYEAFDPDGEDDEDEQGEKS